MVSAKVKKQRKKAGLLKKKSKHLDIPLLPPEDPADEPEVEYVTVGIDEGDPEYKHFKKVFERLAVPEESEGEDSAESDDEEERARKRQLREEKKLRKQQAIAAAKPQKLSKKMQRRMKRMTPAQLKQLVARPDLVEVHDAHAADPKLLLHLKGYPGTVPIPQHWCLKRKYLSAKRGFVKPPFELPSFIAKTGISRIREAYLEREEAKRAAMRSKDKGQPKRARIDIDFQELHDAFFKHAEKPPLSGFGEMYYDGQDQEARNRAAKPGVLSEKLRDALGMGQGMPPPWLVNMQRFGPPPSYPHIKIPGVNAPLPPGASYGYHVGGWGKAPVDEQGRPMYGDCFGPPQPEDPYSAYREKLWGEMASEDEEEEAAPPVIRDEAAEMDGIASVGPQGSDAGTDTGYSAASGDTGTETPDIIELRKRTGAAGAAAAHQVLEQQRASGGTGLMQSSFTYKLPGDAQRDVTVALSEGDLSRLQRGDTGAIQERFAEERASRDARQKEKRKGKDFKF
eukprot:TRINITY_DN8745_c0_g1_i1.p1 TRINITY_DN8745_c0_g1~~TRINITY_DN8745_c0_g1_i1.p1  ORF type:complete len:541 (+),score=217.47 TRINITY_DN8745_c0_g1_i1:96-1625(+)